MATETFFKRIVLSNEAAEKLANGFDEPRAPYVPRPDKGDMHRRGREILRQLSESKKSSEQMIKYL